MTRTDPSLLFAVVLSAVTIGCGGQPGYAGPLPFDAGQWRHGESLGMTDRDTPRLRMADGMVANRVLLGKTRSQLLDMLGPPTTTSKFSRHGLVYWLGPERGFMSIDSEWLVVDFDAQGVAIQAEVTRD